MSDTQELYQCPVCAKRYKRREHLQRHWASHNASRPYRCNQCSRAFQRHDVLKRHARTCEARAKGLIPPSGRRRACDLCVRQKKACSSTQPCRNCERLSVTCSYSFITNSESNKCAGTPKTDVSTESESTQSSESLKTPSIDAASSVGAGAAAFDDLSAVIFGTTPQEPELPFGPFQSRTNATYLDFLDLMSGGPMLDDGGLVLEGTSNSSTSDEPSHGERQLELAAPPPQPQPQPQSQSQPQPPPQPPPQPTQHRTYSFMFLDSFTKRTGFIDSFDCATPALREETLSAFFQQQAESDSMSQHMAALNGEPLLMPGLPDGLAALPTDALIPPAAASLTPTPPFLHNPWLQDPLTIKIHQIVLRARDTVMSKPRNSAITVDWSPQLEQKCLDFFSPTNVRKFLALYWAIWHPNIDVIHRPTFDPATCKLTLLAAMSIIGKPWPSLAEDIWDMTNGDGIGACISPDPADNDNARLWFNCIEEMVFNDDDLGSETLYTLDTGVLIPATQKRKVQALQAAYFVCLFQNWEGTDASKQRIRRYRYSTVVSVGYTAFVHFLPFSRHKKKQEKEEKKKRWQGI